MSFLYFKKTKIGNYSELRGKLRDQLICFKPIAWCSLGWGDSIRNYNKQERVCINFQV